jgi:RNA polymerase sigma-70 factor (ECF subfamily)
MSSPDERPSTRHRVVRRAQFPTTRWTADVSPAGHPDEPGGAAALERLCCDYWYPLYAHIRRQGFNPDLAEELIQEFFFRLLHEGTLGLADRKKGRFRSFLLAVLDHFILDYRKRVGAWKRGGGQVIISFDAEEAEQRISGELSAPDTPEKVFTRTWFWTVHARVLEQMRLEAVDAGKSDEFELLKGFLNDDTSHGDYEELSAKLHKTPKTIAVTVLRLRRQREKLWRTEIARTVADPAAIGGEITHLIAELGR